MNSQLFTDNEKRTAKKIGKVYLGVAKTMGLFFILALILSAVAVANASPSITVVQLEAGESKYLSSFYAESGQEFQFTFGIESENGQYYQGYPQDMEGPTEYIDYLKNMEWLVTFQLYRSESLNFDKPSLVADISGETNVLQLNLPQGFYKIKLTNNHDQQLDVVVGRAHANLGLVVAAITLWVLFGLTVGIFSFMIHFSFWIMVLFVVVKILWIYNDDSKKRVKIQRHIIQPPEYNQNDHRGPRSHNTQM